MTSHGPEVRTRDDEDAWVADLVADLTALAHEHRVRLVKLLTRPRYGEELSEALGTTRQNALKHIQRLEDRKFVRSLHGRRETGPVVEYQIVPQRLFALSVAIAELCRLEAEGGPRQRVSEPTMQDPDPVDARGHEAQVSPARLLILNGPEAGTAFPLDGEGSRWTIGRSEDRGFHLDHDPYISAHHAEVHRALNGHALVDAYSANGTFHNFKRLPRGGRVPLKAGDVIAVGHTQLVYQREPASIS